MTRSPWKQQTGTPPKQTKTQQQQPFIHLGHTLQNSPRYSVFPPHHSALFVTVHSFSIVLRSVCGSADLPFSKAFVWQLRHLVEIFRRLWRARFCRCAEILSNKTTAWREQTKNTNKMLSNQISLTSKKGKVEIAQFYSRSCSRGKAAHANDASHTPQTAGEPGDVFLCAS